MEIESFQPMPLTPRPSPAAMGTRRIEAPRDPAALDSFRPTPGSVPFDVFLEGSNRIARETDTFRLSEKAGEAAGKARLSTEQKSDLATQPPRKSGWAKLGEILPVKRATPPAPAKAPKSQQVVRRPTGTGRIIDLIV